jgi:glutathione S-transferase
MAYTVIGSPISPFVRKVLVVLKEKGIAYEHQDLNPFAPPEGFREQSPLGLIPVFRHGDRVVNDSSVICRYIERLHPEPRLYPADPYACARAEWIEEYADAGLQPVAGRGVFAPLVLRPLMTGKPADETEPRRVVEQDLPRFFDYLDGELGDSGYFVGDALSIADIGVATVFVNLRLAGFAPDRRRWPALAGFLKRMHGRDSFQSVVAPVVAAIGKRWIELD